MSDDDLFLRHALERLAGYPPDEDAAFTMVRYEARVVRRRRYAVSSALCAGVFGLGATALMLRPNPAVDEIGAVPVTTATVNPIIEVTVPTVPLAVVTVATSAAPPVAEEEQLIDPVSAGAAVGTIPPTTLPPETTVAVSEPAAPRVTNPPSPTPRATQPPAVQPPAAPPPATQPPATRPPTTQPPATQPPATQPPATQPPVTPPPTTDPPVTDPVDRLTATKRTTGGTITVEAEGDRIWLVEAKAAEGYSAGIDKERGTSVRVFFSSANTTYRVKAFLEGGEIVFEVQKQDQIQTTTTVSARNGPEQVGSDSDSDSDDDRSYRSDDDKDDGE